MFYKNDYEVTSIDFTEKGTTRMDIRWTVEEKDLLTCLVVLREKIDAKIFRERLRLEEQPGDVCWDGDEKPSGQEETALM